MQPLSEFSYYLRTGRRGGPETSLEHKFNHWHDTENGQFTLKGRGRYFGTSSSEPSKFMAGAKPLKLAQYQRNPRIRMGGNGGPPLQHPRTLEQAFPGLTNAPGGVIIGLADNLFDLTGPAQAITTDWSKAETKKLVREIKALEPTFRDDFFERGSFPTTSEGQETHIKRLRMERAKVYYRRGDSGPLQVEILQFLQQRVDAECTIGLELLRAGKLAVRLSPQEALGNFVDRRVREQFRLFKDTYSLSTAQGFAVQINERAHNTPEGSFSIPDARVGKIAFDWSLTEKSLSTPQVRNFFNADFRPNAVVIVRPRQLGGRSTYIITRPSGH